MTSHLATYAHAQINARPQTFAQFLVTMSGGNATVLIITSSITDAIFAFLRLSCRPTECACYSVIDRAVAVGARTAGADVI